MRQGRALVPVLGLCLLVGTAAYLMVFTLLGQIGADLHASGPLVSWTVTATIITGTVSAALFPAVGAVAGQRRLMTAAKKAGFLVACEPLTRKALPDWIQALAKTKGHAMSYEVADLLAEIAGPLSAPKSRAGARSGRRK